MIGFWDVRRGREERAPGKVDASLYPA